MPQISLFYWKNETLILKLYIQANAANTKLVGIYDDRFKLKVQSPAVGGKANKAIINYLVKQFKIKKNQIKIISGEFSRYKNIAIFQPITIPAIFDIVKNA